jgi:FAD/FMN-containing dehydrogenase
VSSAELIGDAADLLIERGHPSWESARQAWNLAVDQRPAAVAMPAGVDDVVAAVREARQRGWRITAQTTGHGVAPTGDLSEALLIRTSPMTGVRVDAASATARAEGGAVWGDVVQAAAEHGLAPLAGSSADVGVAGYLLGGGLSWLSRRHGLAVNSARAFELVTPDGEFHRVDRDTEPELFWALRGGGGSFGVVTAVDVALYDVPRVYAGQLMWPIARAAEVLRTWREWNSGLARDTSSCARLLRLPPIPEIPEPLRGGEFVVVEVAHVGDEASGAPIVEPLRALAPAVDRVVDGPPSALLDLHMDPDHPVPGCADGALLADCDEETLTALLDIAGPGVDTCLLSVELRGLGGAIADDYPDGGALSRFDAAYAMYAVGISPPPMVERVTAEVNRVNQALAPWCAPRQYLNFREHACSAAELWSDDTLARLRRVAAAYDPDGVMMANHPISR